MIHQKRLSLSLATAFAVLLAASAVTSGSISDNKVNRMMKVSAADDLSELVTSIINRCSRYGRTNYALLGEELEKVGDPRIVVAVISRLNADGGGNQEKPVLAELRNLPLLMNTRKVAAGDDRLTEALDARIMTLSAYDPKARAHLLFEKYSSKSRGVLTINYPLLAADLEKGNDPKVAPPLLQNIASVGSSADAQKLIPFLKNRAFLHSLERSLSDAGLGSFVPLVREQQKTLAREAAAAAAAPAPQPTFVRQSALAPAPAAKTPAPAPAQPVKTVHPAAPAPAPQPAKTVAPQQAKSAPVAPSVTAVPAKTASSQFLPQPPAKVLPPTVEKPKQKPAPVAAARPAPAPAKRPAAATVMATPAARPAAETVTTEKLRRQQGSALKPVIDFTRHLVSASAWPFSDSAQSPETLQPPSPEKKTPAVAPAPKPAPKPAAPAAAAPGRTVAARPAPAPVPAPAPKPAPKIAVPAPVARPVPAPVPRPRRGENIDHRELAQTLEHRNDPKTVREIMESLCDQPVSRQKAAEEIAKVASFLSYDLLHKTLQNFDSSTTGHPRTVQLGLLAALGSKVRMDCSNGIYLDNDKFAKAFRRYNDPAFAEQARLGVAIALKDRDVLLGAVKSGTNWNKLGTADAERAGFTLSVLGDVQLAKQVFDELYRRPGERLDNLEDIARVVSALDYPFINKVVKEYVQDAGTWSDNDYIYKFGITSGLSAKIRTECTIDNVFKYHLMLNVLKSFDDRQLAAQVLIGMSYAQVPGHFPAPSRDIILAHLSGLMHSSFRDSRGIGGKIGDIIFCFKLNPQVKAELRRLYLPQGTKES